MCPSTSRSSSVRASVALALLALGLDACRDKGPLAAPLLTVDVQFLGPAQLEHLDRNARIAYRSRKSHGLVFRSHRLREDIVPIAVTGDRLRLMVAKRTFEKGDTYDLDGVSLRYETDRDRRFGFSPTTLGIYPTEED